MKEVKKERANIKNQLKLTFQKTLPRLLVLSLSFLITILVIEIFLRIFYKDLKPGRTAWQNSGPFQIDPVLIYKNYSYKSDGEYWNNDQEGFRLNPKHQYAEENTTKIITIGDSFTYGHGVKNSETFSYLLEQKLNAGKLIATEEKTDGVLPEASKYSIHNAGTPGYGVDQEFLLIKQILNNYQPQLIIWNLNVNDVGDSNYACLFKKTKNDQYQQISGRRNTLYLAESIKKIPMIDKSYLMELILDSIPKRYTLGCTTTEYNYSDFEEKFFYFLAKVNQLKDPQTQLLITLMPDLRELDGDDKNNFLFDKSFAAHPEFNFINLNQGIANNSLKVLGASSDLMDYSLMFLAEPEFYSPHSNQFGHEIISQTLYNQIIKIKAN